jgi:F0F1-type ATP synthase membrane subunit b/b'
MKLNVLTILTVLTGTCLAADGGDNSHGSPSDLISSFVNIALLAAGLLYILVPKMKEHFSTKSNEVTNIMERASIKAKEAKMLMDVQKKKMDNLDAEIIDLKKDGETEISNFRANYSEEIDTRISKLKEDAAKKIETEKQELANNLNEELLDAVIASAKIKIKADKNLGSEATSKMLEGL